jgi:hypothetical protein
MVVLGGGALGRRLGLENRALINGISAFIKKAQEIPVPTLPCEVRARI